MVGILMGAVLGEFEKLHLENGTGLVCLETSSYGGAYGQSRLDSCYWQSSGPPYLIERNIEHNLHSPP